MLQALRRNHGSPSGLFCDKFAQYVATGYIDGRFSYESADSAIAGLYLHFAYGVPEFATSVFGCFDDAEYRRTQGSNPDEIARQLVKKILNDKHELPPNKIR